MTFLQPAALWLLLPVAALGALYVLLQVRRRDHAVRFTNLDLLDKVAPSRPGWRRHVTAALLGLAMIGLVLGLARPVREEEVAKERTTIVLAVDVSASMTAIDVEPDRLSAAVAAAKTFVERLPETIQVGVVSFDRSARVVVAPTDDHEDAIAGLDRLRVGEGTAAGEAIYTALDVLSAPGDTTTETDEPAGAIVLLSDGVSTSGRTVEDAADAAAEATVPVTTIAYGTPDGTVRVEGQVVPVPADAETMRAVAEATGGSAFVAATGDELAAVYADIGQAVGFETEEREIGMRFVAAAVALLFAALLAALVWMGRVI
jgi:Ca-activated chloride channel family protein